MFLGQQWYNKHRTQQNVFVTHGMEGKEKMLRFMALLAALVASMAASATDAWLTRPQLAERLQISVKTAAQWASAGKGPKCARLGGGFVRYRLSDVEAWEATQFSGGDAA